MFVIGLTGGIGTGKTAVSDVLEGLGAAIINADLLGHQAYRPDTEAWQRVVESFGKGVLGPSGEVDRRKLGSIVFSDPEALARLNSIVHPRIYEMVEERIAALRDEGRKVAVVEAALLLEAKWDGLVDEVWVTASDEEQVVRRLRGRGMDEEAIRARVESQMSQAERAKRADVLIDNDGSLAELDERVRQLWYSRASGRQEIESQV